MSFSYEFSCGCGLTISNTATSPSPERCVPWLEHGNIILLRCIQKGELTPNKNCNSIMRTLLFLLVLLTSCSVPDKASLRVSRETRKLKKSPVTLRAERKGGKTIDRLQLRRNNSFEYQSLVLGTQKIVIYAGTFTMVGDSLSLAFHNNHKDNSWTGKAFIDTANTEVTIVSLDPKFNRHLTIIKLWRDGKLSAVNR